MFETDRLILRKYRQSDLLDLYEYLSDPEVVAYEPYSPLTMAQVQSCLDERCKSDEMIALELKQEHKLIGNIYLGQREFHSLELGYVLNRRYWGNGYAAEACDKLIRRSFGMGVHRIYAQCDPANVASWHLLEHLGFRREAHFKKDIYFRKDQNGMPIWKDTYVYAMINEDIRRETNGDCPD